jgi:hypothetical protein
MSNTIRRENNLEEPVEVLDREKPPFIAELWCVAFGFLSQLSMFFVVRKLVPSKQRSRRFTDGWVLGHLLASILLAVASSVPGLAWWELIFIIYAGFRIFELVVYLINILLLNQVRVGKEKKRYSFREYRRIVILAIHNYAELIFWFTLIYRNVGGAFTTDPTSVLDLGSFSGAFSYSFHTISSFGYSSATPIGKSGTALVTLQACIGLFMMVFILARFVALLPISTKDEFENGRIRPR